MANDSRKIPPRKNGNWAYNNFFMRTNQKNAEAWRSDIIDRIQLQDPSIYDYGYTSGYTVHLSINVHR